MKMKMKDKEKLSPPFVNLTQRFSEIDMKFYTTLSSDLLSEISVISRLLILFLSLLIKPSSSILFLIIVCYLSWRC